MLSNLNLEVSDLHQVQLQNFVSEHVDLGLLKVSEFTLDKNILLLFNFLGDEFPLLLEFEAFIVVFDTPLVSVGFKLFLGWLWDLGSFLLLRGLWLSGEMSSLKHWSTSLELRASSHVLHQASRIFQHFYYLYYFYLIIYSL